MTSIAVAIMKVEEHSEWAKYAFGNPPHKVLGNVIIYKKSGDINLIDIIDDKYKKYILPCVKKKLTEHHELGEYPEHTFYAC